MDPGKFSFEEALGVFSMTRCLATVALLFNIFLPGVGTMIVGCKMSGGLRSQLIQTGLLQLCLAVCIIGWIWALYSSCKFCEAASQMEKVNEIVPGIGNITEMMKKMEHEIKDMEKAEANNRKNKPQIQQKSEEPVKEEPKQDKEVEQVDVEVKQPSSPPKN